MTFSGAKINSSGMSADSGSSCSGVSGVSVRSGEGSSGRGSGLGVGGCSGGTSSAIARGTIASSTPQRKSSAFTANRPFRAAWALAIRVANNSARCPDTCPKMASFTKYSICSVAIVTCLSQDLASTI